MQVTVLGAGYAGLVVARKLEGALPDGVDLLVVDESGDHLVQHELHRVVRRPTFADHVTVPVADLLDTATVRQATVTDIDTEARRVHLADGDALDYDAAAVCLGADPNFFDLPGVAEHGTPLKRVDHATEIRRRYLDVLDGGGGQVVVGGAGLSGIQVAGELAALARERGQRDRVRIVLVEQADGVAPAFPANFRSAVRDELERCGVVVRTDTAVTRATDEAVHVESGGPIDCDQLVWTGGIRGTAALGGERPVVRASLEYADRTFVVGDAARVVDADGEAVPDSAQAAVREARTAAENIRTVFEGDGHAAKFRFDSPGWIVSVGDGAVAQVGPVVLRGAAARSLKRSVGAGYLASAGAVREAVDLFREEFR